MSKSTCRAESGSAAVTASSSDQAHDTADWTTWRPAPHRRLLLLTALAYLGWIAWLVSIAWRG